MECPGFFGLDLRESALLVATLGMLHPVLCIVPAKRFRSEFFVALYLLALAWSFVSALLLAGVLGETIALYWVWIWFTLIFVVVMIISMVIMIIGFYTLKMRRMTLLPVAGIIFYILTMYFICVVHSQQKVVQQGRAYPEGVGGAGRTGTVAGACADSDGVQATTPALRSAPTSRKRVRGRCGIPPRKPNNGVYRAALADNKLALPGHGYHRLRLWVYCDQSFRPRNLEYSYCYSGGWNLPLPDCVRNETWYDEYYYNDDAPESTVKSTDVCVLPRPPEHGYFTREATISARYISLAVRCNPLHYLVGWQRLSCHDGVWNRPMPKCLFSDITVCTLLKRTDAMIRTCLPSQHYPAAYRCDAGLVPHGAVLEPRCPRHHYVWGPFTYLHCVNGEWHPRILARTVACEHAVDIYRHFEMLDKGATTTLSREPTRIGSLLDDDAVENNPQSLWIEMENFLNRNLTNNGTTRRKKKIHKTGKKIAIIDIWKAQTDEEKIVDTDFINKTIWRVHKGTRKAFSINSTGSKMFDPQKNNGEPLDDDSIRTYYWKLQREALKADSIDANIWKTEKHVGKSLTMSNQKIRKARYEVGDKSKTNTNNSSNWASRANDYGEFTANTNNVSIWKYQSRTGYSPITISNEISIWKDQSENYGERPKAKAGEISIWKTQNPSSDTLRTISTKNSIWKTRNESDRPIYQKTSKVNAKRARKKNSKWLGAHSRKTRRLHEDGVGLRRPIIT